MNLIFTKHAKERMIERGIPLEDIKTTLSLPEYTVRKNGKIESYKDFDGKTLKVVSIDEGKFIKIITLIWK